MRADIGMLLVGVLRAAGQRRGNAVGPDSLFPRNINDIACCRVAF